MPAKSVDSLMAINGVVIANCQFIDQANTIRRYLSKADAIMEMPHQIRDVRDRVPKATAIKINYLDPIFGNNNLAFMEVTMNQLGFVVCLLMQEDLIADALSGSSNWRVDAAKKLGNFPDSMCLIRDLQF